MAAVTNTVLFLGVILSCFFFFSEAKVSHGHVTGYEFVYLDKFCFYGQRSYLNFTITSKSQNVSNFYLLFVDDQDGNWTDVYKHKLTCQQRLEKTKPEMIFNYGNNTQVGHVMFNDTRRPHFWYIAALDCGQKIDVKFDFTFIQDSDSKWVRQFSYDEQGLEGLYLFYFIFFLLASAVHGYTIWTFLQTGSYHLIVRLYTACVALEGLSVFSYFVHYASYSSNGVGSPFMRGLGDFLDICCQVVFILLVILIAKGWCISKTQIDDRKIVLGGLGALIILYFSMFIWVHTGLDPASTLYVYQTAPGIIIIVIRVLAMFWFVYSMRNTYMEENNAGKRKFYLYFGIAFLVWFLTLPFITSVGAGSHPWHRQKIVMSMYVTFNTIFLVVLGVLLWPSRAGEYFQISAKGSVGGFGSVPYDSI